MLGKNDDAFTRPLKGNDDEENKGFYSDILKT